MFEKWRKAFFCFFSYKQTQDIGSYQVYVLYFHHSSLVYDIIIIYLKLFIRNSMMFYSSKVGNGGHLQRRNCDEKLAVL